MHHQQILFTQAFQLLLGNLHTNGNGMKGEKGTKIDEVSYHIKNEV